MADVFVSYRRADISLVLPIVDALKTEGLTVWWDQDIAANDDWEQTIEFQLRSAKAVVVVWSRTSAESQNVRAEARSAHSEARLVQVVIGECQIPLFLSEQQAIDLRTKRERGVAELVGAVRALVRGERPELARDATRNLRRRNEPKYRGEAFAFSCLLGIVSVLPIALLTLSTGFNPEIMAAEVRSEVATLDQARYLATTLTAFGVLPLFGLLLAYFAYALVGRRPYRMGFWGTLAVATIIGLGFALLAVGARPLVAAWVLVSGRASDLADSVFAASVFEVPSLIFTGAALVGPILVLAFLPVFVLLCRVAFDRRGRRWVAFLAMVTLFGASGTWSFFVGEDRVAHQYASRELDYELRRSGLGALGSEYSEVELVDYARRAGIPDWDGEHAILLMRLRALPSKTDWTVGPGSLWQAVSQSAEDVRIRLRPGMYSPIRIQATSRSIELFGDAEGVIFQVGLPSGVSGERSLVLTGRVHLSNVDVVGATSTVPAVILSNSAILSESRIEAPFALQVGEEWQYAEDDHPVSIRGVNVDSAGVRPPIVMFAEVALTDSRIVAPGAAPTCIEVNFTRATIVNNDLSECAAQSGDRVRTAAPGTFFVSHNLGARQAPIQASEGGPRW